MCEPPMWLFGYCMCHRCSMFSGNRCRNVPECAGMILDAITTLWVILEGAMCMCKEFLYVGRVMQ